MSVDTFLEGVLTLADTMGNTENFLFNCNCLRKIAITCILGTTCFPNPFPRSGKYPKHVSPLKYMAYLQQNYLLVGTIYLSPLWNVLILNHHYHIFLHCELIVLPTKLLSLGVRATF